ncbi:MAG: VWA domain-containing protein [Rhodobacterales bacterium]|nr:MAG: VWA domain-containing protein [Rhodobacterales bacterium]
MVQLADLPLPDHPRLAENITHFVRALRRAGLPVGPGHVIDAARAVAEAGFTRRSDFYWTLHACLTSRPEHHAVFDQVFRLYWRDPRFMEHMMAMLLPMVRGVQDERAAQPAARRAAEALLDGHAPEQPEPEAPPEEIEISFDASRTASARERLRTLDFEQMSPEELARAKAALARMVLRVPPLPSRRFHAAPGATSDPRRTLRRMMRQGGTLTRIETRRRATRPPSLVVLCDISGSMSRYARTILHFIHATKSQPGAGWRNVHAFTFGTRLTNITCHMEGRDIDAALHAAGAEAQDWEGGTRIGACLSAFNRDWSRRVLGQGAVVLLITDGLERDPGGELGAASERLALSCKRLIWVNPLLRFDGFAPKVAGIRAILPHVDAILPGHDIASIEGLVAAIGDPNGGGHKARLMAAL